MLKLQINQLDFKNIFIIYKQTKTPFYLTVSFDINIFLCLIF